MEKQRIQVYADPEIKRRIELAAARYAISVTEYCLIAIRQQLADDDLLDQEQIEIPVIPGKAEAGLLDDLSELQERISTRRRGKPIDVDILELMREERDNEVTGLH